MDPVEIEGGCMCGEVRYRATCEPSHSTICHCSDCRKAAGAQSVAWLTFPAESFSFVKGSPGVYRSSEHVERTFCPPCGTSLSYRNDHRPDAVDVTTGSADDPEPFPPKEQVFPDEKISWA